MSRTLSTPGAPLRRITPFLLALVLLILTGMSISRVVQLRDDLAVQMERQLGDDLQDRIAAWEDQVVRELTDWSVLVAANPKRVDEIQTRLRQVKPWFDAVYVWAPTEEMTISGRSVTSQGYFLFPDDHPLREHPDVINRIPCLARARLFSSQPTADPLQTALAWRAWCQNQDASVRTLALTEAVNVLLRVGLVDEAARAIEEDGFPAKMSLREVPKLGIPPARAMILQTQRAEVLELQGDSEAAYDLLFRIGMEICSMDGPDARLLLKWVSFPIIDRLKHHDLSRAQVLELARQRAQRRVKGYEDVAQNLVTREAPEAAQEGRFIADPFAEEPYLLFTIWPEGTNVGVAIQIDERGLLGELLGDLKRYRRQLTITNQRGRVAGVAMTAPPALEVPFSRTLTHLRVGLHETAVEARLTRLNGIWIVPAILLAMVVLMGVISLVEQVRAGRQQRLLLERQKEFATRVTHELKTPLAGIRVMAEGLEMGLFKDEEDRQSMARSIVREADNLTDRVNEILAVTRERVLRQPEVFDPEEPVFEAVDAWGPRLEQAGIAFEADLEPTDEVFGDPEAIRDAVACLLDNAIKYRREDSESRVSLTVQQVGHQVEIAVTDNGLGVPKNMRKQVFDRFVRVEGDNRGKAGGHGLGLAQVASIMAAHEGSARCEEGFEGGARFVLCLPVHRS